MGAGEAQHAHAAEFDVDLHFRDMGAGTEHGIGLALSVGIERRGRGIVGLADLDHEAGGVDGEAREIEPRFAEPDNAGAEADRRILARIGEAQQLAPHGLARPSRGVAGDEGLARGGGLAAVGRRVGVGAEKIDGRQ